MGVCQSHEKSQDCTGDGLRLSCWAPTPPDQETTVVVALRTDEQQEEGDLEAPAADVCGAAVEAEAVSLGAPRLRTLGRRTEHRFVRGQTPLVPPENTTKTPEEAESLAAALRSNPNWKVLAPFGEAQINFLVDSAWREDVPPGRAIMFQGDLDNNTFYVVQSGSFQVSASDPYEVVEIGGQFYLSRAEPMRDMAKDGWIKSGRDAPVTRKIGPKTLFGDSSMLYSAPRWTTAIAAEHSVVWVISQSNFRAAQIEVSVAQSTQKSEADVSLVRESLLKNANLQRVTPLSARHVEDLTKVAWSLELKAGQVLMRMGDLNADSLFILGSGLVELHGQEPFEVVKDGNALWLERAAHSGRELCDGSKVVTRAEVGRGIMFGEISMSYCAPRFATVTAVEDSMLWAIDRSNFQMVQMQAAEDEVLDRVRHLESVESVQSLSKFDKEKMAAVMETMRFGKGETMAVQGEPAHAMFILLQGRVERVVGKKVAQVYEADPAKGTDCRLSEESLSMTTPKQAVHKSTLRVVSDVATALVLEREEFQKVWDRLLEAAPAPTFERFTTSVTKGRDPTPDGIAMNRLSNLGLLGVGSLGLVELCRHQKTGELYAVKKMSKGLIIRKGYSRSVLEERHVWIEVLSPFVVRLCAASREEQHLCYVLEFAAGGELSEAYARHKLHGCPKHAKYYVAAVVLAISHLHKRKIIYRNLKPQNVMLSAHGRPKITDLSLAKRIAGGYTFTTCGTPTFMAPEILTGAGHTRAVDWWSVGVFAYWLMAGVGPFDSEHPMDVYAMSLRGIARVEFPAVCCGALKDLIVSMLNPVALDRPAMRQGGIRNVTDHAWFKGFDWKAMRACTVEPPYVPQFSVSPTRWKEDEHPPQVYLQSFAPDAAKLPDPVPTAVVEDWDEDFVTG